MKNKIKIKLRYIICAAISWISSPDQREWNPVEIKLWGFISAPRAKPPKGYIEGLHKVIATNPQAKINLTEICGGNMRNFLRFLKIFNYVSKKKIQSALDEGVVRFVMFYHRAAGNTSRKRMTPEEFALCFHYADKMGFKRLEILLGIFLGFDKTKALIDGIQKANLMDADRKLPTDLALILLGFDKFSETCQAVRQCPIDVMYLLLKPHEQRDSALKELMHDKFFTFAGFADSLMEQIDRIDPKKIKYQLEHGAIPEFCKMIIDKHGNDVEYLLMRTAYKCFATQANTYLLELFLKAAKKTGNMVDGSWMRLGKNSDIRENFDKILEYLANSFPEYESTIIAALREMRDDFMEKRLTDIINPLPEPESVPETINPLSEERSEEVLPEEGPEEVPEILHNRWNRRNRVEEPAGHQEWHQGDWEGGSFDGYQWYEDYPADAPQQYEQDGMIYYPQGQNKWVCFVPVPVAVPVQDQFPNPGAPNYNRRRTKTRKPFDPLSIYPRRVPFPQNR